MTARTYGVREFMEAARKQEAELRAEYARLVELDQQGKARTRAGGRSGSSPVAEA